MEAFLHNISHFPGVLPTFVVGVLLAFWLLAILGMLDFETFGPDWLGGGDLELETDTEGSSAPTAGRGNVTDVAVSAAAPYTHPAGTSAAMSAAVSEQLAARIENMTTSTVTR